MGWLGWGLGTAHAFTPTVIIFFDVFGILLLGYSIYFIRKGRSLRRNYAASSNALTQRMSKTVYCPSCFGMYGNRNSRFDCLRLSSSRFGPCLGRYRGGTPFPSPRQDFSAGPLLFLGDRDNLLVRCLRHFVSFQFARSMEQHRDGRSALGQLRTRFTASPRNRAFTRPVAKLLHDE
jgi:hypothetical protein